MSYIALFNLFKLWLEILELQFVVGFLEKQEYMNIKKLGDSLLTRSTKISDLIGQIEDEATERKGPDMERATKNLVFTTCCMYHLQFY